MDAPGAPRPRATRNKTAQGSFTPGRAGALSRPLQGVRCVATRSRGAALFFEPYLACIDHPLPPAPRPPPGGQGSGTRKWRGARLFAAFRTHCIGARWAGDAALTAWLAGCARLPHRAGLCLSARCPWRGYEENGRLGRRKRWVQEDGAAGRGADGFVALRRGRGGFFVILSHTWLASITPYPQPLGPLQGAGGAGCGMAWRADFRGFPYTLSRCPMGGRRGADDAVGGLCAAAPQGRSVLVCALPLAGDTKKMDCWGAASVVSRNPVGGPGVRMALLHCARWSRVSVVFRATTGLQRAPPYPQPPSRGPGGAGCAMARRAAFRGFPYTLSRWPMGGRRGADGVVGGITFNP